jgi:hypothetical protein
MYALLTESCLPKYVCNGSWKSQVMRWKNRGVCRPRELFRLQKFEMRDDQTRMPGRERRVHACKSSEQLMYSIKNALESADSLWQLWFSRMSRSAGWRCPRARRCCPRARLAAFMKSTRPTYEQPRSITTLRLSLVAVLMLLFLFWLLRRKPALPEDFS